MTQVHSYAAYKDSGVEWLKAVPSHWRHSRLKEICEVKGRIGFRGYSKDDLVTAGEGALLVGATEMHVDGYLSINNPKFISWLKYYESPEIILCPGDLLIAQRGSTIGKAILIPKDIGKATINPTLVSLKHIRKIHRKYLLYFVMSPSLQSFICSQIASTAIPMISQQQIGNYVIFYPPLLEQTAIAAYLDTKTAQLDRKIERLVQKATQYGKLKQSLINETVTRGLDKTVAMKDSGVEWIGEVPAHWEVQRIGTAFEERSEKVNDTDYPPLSVSMGGIVPQMESVAKTDNNENRKRVAVGDYVINSRSDRRGASGISIYDGSVSVISIVLAPRRSFFGKYLHHLFRSYSFIEEFYRVGRGIVDDLWTTRYSVMKGIEFAYPSYEEQKIIADYLDSKTAHIDRIVAALNSQIDKLKELRKTLINDIVTGKICILEQGGAGALDRPDAERG